MKPLRSALLSAAAALLTAVPAFADSVTYTLTTLDPTIIAGGSVTFSGVITATASNAASVSLLGDAFSINGPATLDETPFYSSPAELNPGTAYAGPLFTLTLPATAAAGTYTGSFDLLVGENGGQIGGEDTYSGPFQYTVAGGATVTPEPGTWLLLSTGLAGAGLLRRRLAARF